MTTQRMQAAVRKAKGYHAQVMLGVTCGWGGAVLSELRAARAYWMQVARSLHVGVQQVSAQSVYTLELAVGEEVAHKEYRDYTRAKQAYEDAVLDVLMFKRRANAGVTRIELFSEAVGSMDKWERGQ